VPLEPTKVAMLPPVEPTAAAAAPVAETVAPTPTESAAQTAPTREPVDVSRLVYSSLPPVFVGAGVLFLLVIVAAGLSVIRGPRDI